MASKILHIEKLPVDDVRSVEAPPIKFNWHDIAFFLELVRAGHLVDAAKKLKVNHATVSRRIRELEQSLNAKLFERTPSGFVLTSTGMKMLDYAERMEFQANSIPQAIGARSQVVSGSVRIATMEGFGSYYLAPKLAGLKERHPDITVELVTSSGWIDLSRREADVFVSFSRPTARRLSVEKISGFRVQLFASKDYLARAGEPKAKVDLSQHDFIDFIDELVQISSAQWLPGIVSSQNVVFRSTSLIAQYAAACNGLGIAALPAFLACQSPKLRPVLPEIYVSNSLWMSAHMDLLHLPRVSAVVRFIAEQTEEDADAFGE